LKTALWELRITRKKYMPRYLALLVLSIASQFALAGTPLEIRNIEAGIDLKKHARYFADVSTELSVAQIRVLDLDSPDTFLEIPERKGPMIFGYTSSAIWIRFDLVNRLDEDKIVIFDFENPRLSDINLFQFNDDQLIHQDRGGDSVSLTERHFQSRSIPFPITLPANNVQTVYFRIVNLSSMAVPLKLYSAKSFFAQKSTKDIIIYAIIGIYLGFIFYNLMIYIGQREKIYLAFLTLTSGRLLYDLYLGGAGQLLTPNLSYWNDLAYLYCGSLASFAAFWFHIEFLDLRKNSIKGYWFIVGYAALLLFGNNFAYFMGPAYYIPVSSLIIAMPFVLIISTIPSIRRGYRPARLYLYGSLITLLSVIWSNLNLLGVLNTSYDIAIISALAYCTSFVVFAFSISSRIDELTHSKNLALVDAETAQARDNAKSEFLAHMSHEIRTPLNGVLGMIQILKDSGLKEKQKELAGIIQSSGQSLLNIVNDVLDFSKIEAGKLTIEKIPFNPREILGEIHALFSHALNNNNVKIRLIIDGNVPEWLNSDPSRIKQILMNLVGNAGKFTKTGSIKIAMGALGHDGFYRISVTDTGVGIAKEQQSKLFSSFEQTRSDIHRQYGGTGLGLAISKQLSELLGGKIDFSSEENQGAKFWIDLPLPLASQPEKDITNKASADDSPAAQGSANDQKNIGSNEPLTILIAEDNKVNQMVCRLMLEKLGQHVVVVSDGQEVVDEYQAHHSNYNMILMDCDMPGKDGYQATIEIRDHEQQKGLNETPIIALTAHAVKESRTKSLQSGMNEHITKPLKIEQLEDLLLRYRSGQLPDSSLNMRVEI